MADLAAVCALALRRAPGGGTALSSLAGAVLAVGPCFAICDIARAMLALGLLARMAAVLVAVEALELGL